MNVMLCVIEENVIFGYMSSSLMKSPIELELLGSQASFVELQIHDKLKRDIITRNNIKIPENFIGYLTIHGEGETDGIPKIKFCSSDKEQRQKYVNESVNLYSLISKCINTHTIPRVILHPDNLSKKISRKQQIELLAKS